MPIYEYECQACQKITETRQSIKDAPLTTCGVCGGAMNKIISQTSFQLKGGGWYADGYTNCNGKDKGCAAEGSCPAAAPSSSASASSASPASSSATPTPACGSCGC